MIDTEETAVLHNRVATWFDRLYRPGTQQFHALVHTVAHPTNGAIAFSGTIYDSGGGFPVTRIGVIGGDGGVTLLSETSSSDTDPKWSPDGSQLAFLSDRGRGGGNFQLFFAMTDDLARQQAGPTLEGEAVESFAWSRDGARILIQSADAGADAAGSASTARIGSRSDERPSWMPSVETGSHDNLWRRARIWNRAADTLTVIGAPGQNVWEADWCGDDEIVAILSASPTEGGWYQTEIGIAPAAGGAFVRFAKPGLELAKPAGSPDGRHIAVIEGRFHRTVALGSLTLYDRATGEPVQPDTGAEVSTLTWRNDDRLFFAGFQSPQSVAGTYDLTTRTTAIEWRAPGTAGRKVPAAWPAGYHGLTLPAHGFDRYPQVVRIEDNGTETVALDLTHNGVRTIMAGMKSAEAISWQGRDGLIIRGYLALPANVQRPPLVTFIHGGPSHLFRDSWSFDNPLAALLVSSGYAVLFPNPRGTSGHGLDFASRVIGDMAGEDAHDILAGADHVIAHYDVDPTRQFVTGGSYGGFMTCWLVGQTDRFQAACALAPLTDMRSQFFTAHHPEFLSLYSKGDPYDVGGVFDQRSPLAHADKVVTPTLLIAGERDKTTPSAQAVQFHHALVLNGVPSELALYPEEGHAAARFEAQIDQGVRVLRWFADWTGRNTGAAAT